VLSVVVHGATADPLAIRHARLLDRQADGHAVAEVPGIPGRRLIRQMISAHSARGGPATGAGRGSGPLKAGTPSDLGSEVLAPLWLMVEPAAVKGATSSGEHNGCSPPRDQNRLFGTARRKGAIRGNVLRRARLAGPESVAGRLTSTRR
jgi:hypothetical protein